MNVMFAVLGAALILYTYFNRDKIAFMYLYPRRIRPSGEVETDVEKIDYSSYHNWARQTFEKKETALFFIYPTLPSEGRFWNMDIEQARCSPVIPNYVEKWQTSAFESFCDIFIPYYRQSSMYCIFRQSGKQAFSSMEIAYKDVRDAFVYFVEHFLGERDFIIASHSQGTAHADRLIKECVIGTDFEKRLRCAYLVGGRIAVDDYADFVDRNGDRIYAWNTFLKGSRPVEVFYTTPIFRNGYYTRKKVKMICHIPEPDKDGCYTAYSPKTGFFYPVRGDIKNGIWYIDKPENEYFTSKQLVKGWLHIYDFQFVWKAIGKDIEKNWS